MSMLNISGYNLDPELRVDRADTLNGIGGGILVYAKNGLILKPTNIENNFNQFTQFEILNSDDQSSVNYLNVTVIYRPPSGSDANTNELCKLLDSAKKTLYLLVILIFLLSTGTLELQIEEVNNSYSVLMRTILNN